MVPLSLAVRDSVWNVHPGGGDVGELLEGGETLSGDWALPE